MPEAMNGIMGRQVFQSDFGVTFACAYVKNQKGDDDLLILSSSNVRDTMITSDMFIFFDV